MYSIPVGPISRRRLSVSLPVEYTTDLKKLNWKKKKYLGIVRWVKPFESNFKFLVSTATNMSPAFKTL